jgi:hypothetical protein
MSDETWGPVDLTHGPAVAPIALARTVGIKPSRTRRAHDAVVEYDLKNAWVEQTIAPGWVAAYRLGIADGHPVVAEIRIFPDVWPAGTARPRGSWAGSFLGLAVTGVPRGGVGMKTVRKIRGGEALRYALELIGQVRLSRLVSYEWAPPSLLSAADLAVGRQWEVARGAAPARLNGSKRIDDLTLAKLAQRFVRLKHSVKAVCRELGLEDSTVRSRLMLARDRGLLTKSGKSGVRGGVLTRTGEEVLAAARAAKTRGPKRKETGQ